MQHTFGLDVIRGSNMMQHVATSMQQNEHVHFVACLLQHVTMLYGMLYSFGHSMQYLRQHVVYKILLQYNGIF